MPSLQNTRDNSRIAKNTFFLYGRMIFLTCINIYTVSITLKVLGVIDYGIFNVVGSLVALFTAITGTLVSASQRFLAFNLGTKDYIKYSETFTLLLIAYLIICSGIIIIAEIFEPIAFNDVLDIPADRLTSAKWIYQTSLFSFIITLLGIPFTSSIVSHEKMSAFAYISIIDGILKLGLVYLLTTIKLDRLILYGILTLLETLIIFSIYFIYCKKKFPYCRWKYSKDKDLFRNLTSYTGWNLIGSLSAVLAKQGQNILLNNFFGPVINTAKGIADKIYNVVYSFCSNFYMAISPQIIKSYAANDLDRMRFLAISSSKLSFILLYVISFPMIISMPSILILWLGTDGATEDMAGFSRLALLEMYIMCLEAPITHMIRATGKMKRYQVEVGIITLLYLPIAWIALKIDRSPLLTMWILIGVYSCVHYIRLKIAKQQVGLNIKIYTKKVIIPIITILLLSIPIYMLLGHYIHNTSLENILINGGIGLLYALIIVWIVGLNIEERKFIRSKVYNIFKTKI